MARQPAATPAAARGTSPIDTPDQHGFVMSGVETVFLSHLPMFAMVNHRYQVVLRVELPPAALATYAADRALHPTTPYVLGNVATDLMTLPELNARHRTAFRADVFRGAPADPNKTKPLIHDVEVTIASIPHFRHFDPADTYPPRLTYLMYGTAREAHLAHYIVREPDFDHVLDLAVVPDWLDPVQLTAGVRIEVQGMSDTGHCANPFGAGSYAVTYEGQPPLYEITPGISYWFETSSLNPVDPCATAPTTTKGTKHEPANRTTRGVRTRT